VLVFHDILNLTGQQPAKFVRQYGDAAALISSAVANFKADVEAKLFPSDGESYHLPRETQAALENLRLRKSTITR
jgi:3-methyl-2-oxobutanoate hydroxymethyltransferase